MPHKKVGNYFRVRMKLFQLQAENNPFFQRIRANRYLLAANCFLIITAVQVINEIFQQRSQLHQNQINENSKKKTAQQEENDHETRFQRDMNNGSGEEKGGDFEVRREDDLFAPQNPPFVPAETMETQWNTEADSTDPFERAAPSPKLLPQSYPPQGQAKKAYAVGDIVQATWKGGTKYYSGKIVYVHDDGTYAIQFNDGDYEPKAQPGSIHSS